MNKEQQISEAWETYSVIRDTGETPEETFKNGVRGGIEIGLRFLNLLCKEGRCPEFYRKSDDNLAAMKDLYVDLDLNMSECCDFEWYWILTDDGWHHAMRVDFGFDIVSPGGDDLLFSCGQEDVRRVIEARLPSPSDLFTEIKFN